MAALLTASTEAARTLPMAPVWFGVLALAAFAALLAVTFAFRNIGNRH